MRITNELRTARRCSVRRAHVFTEPVSLVLLDVS
jgi:hypothetical protein